MKINRTEIALLFSLSLNSGQFYYIKTLNFVGAMIVFVLGFAFVLGIYFLSFRIWKKLKDRQP
jgi:hypothetical protein